MPKRIAGVQESIYRRAEELIMLGQYDSFSIRTIAKDCGIAVGTLYNYFSSKDELLMSVISEHWRKMTGEVDVECASSKSIQEGVCIICRGIRKFAEEHIKFWEASMTGGFVYSAGMDWKGSLHKSVESRLINLFSKYKCGYDQRLIPAIAEVIIALGSQCELDLDIALELLKKSTDNL